ncbi:MAG TPA: sigma-70 family RNA polymerase sigma factor [Pyrinomonadaceae bacterium]|nr:sigma-70 family RNA polymerase sigma factor [Pyrinomonadaceae bacterium]
MSDSWNECSDGQLIEACLDGDEKAWLALVTRYRRLVYSIPTKCGFSPQDAVDIFQAVWVDCFRELASLGDVERLQPWLIRVTVRNCHRFSTDRRDRAEDFIVEDRLDDLPGIPDPVAFLAELDREQILRVAMEQLPPRCRQVIQLLFFEEPRPSYQAVASRLGLSENSIDFTGERCLSILKGILDEMGYKK